MEHEPQEFARTLLARQCDRIRKAKKGSRRPTLDNAILMLAPHVAGGDLDRKACLDAVFDASEDLRLVDGDASVLAAIEEGLTNGARLPVQKLNGNGAAHEAEPAKDHPGPAENKRAGQLESARASTYQMRAIRWFWAGRFAIGKLGLIGGLPDKGKGLISADMIARCTRAQDWPCNEGKAPQGNVIWFTAEDDIEDTVIPRLVAAGADLDRVHIIGMAKNPDSSPRMFNLATDLPLLLGKIEQIGEVVLVIIDPVSAYLGIGKVNNSSTTDVRGMLAPLTKLAEEKHVSIIGIMHFNKKADVTNAMLRIADSLAYVAAARHVYVVVDDSENEKARLFVKAKNNLAPDKHALRFMVGVEKVGTDPDDNQDIWAPRVIWDSKYVEVTATEAMEAAEGGGTGRAASREAEEYLRVKLAHGPVLKQEIEEEAKAMDISITGALKRAKLKLKVVTYKEKGKADGNWLWELPSMILQSSDP